MQNISGRAENAPLKGNKTEIKVYKTQGGNGATL